MVDIKFIVEKYVAGFTNPRFELRRFSSLPAPVAAGERPLFSLDVRDGTLTVTNARVVLAKSGAAEFAWCCEMASPPRPLEKDADHPVGRVRMHIGLAFSIPTNAEWLVYSIQEPSTALDAAGEAVRWMINQHSTHPTRIGEVGLVHAPHCLAVK